MITLEAGHLDSPKVLLDCGFLASGWALVSSAYTPLRRTVFFDGVFFRYILVHVFLCDISFNEV